MQAKFDKITINPYLIKFPGEMEMMRACSTWASAATMPISYLAATWTETTSWVQRPPPPPLARWETRATLIWETTGLRSTRQPNCKSSSPYVHGLEMGLGLARCPKWRLRPLWYIWRCGESCSGLTYIWRHLGFPKICAKLVYTIKQIQFCWNESDIRHRHCIVIAV